MKNIVVLGSTGSIGRSTCDVLSSHQDQFRLSGIAAGTNIDLLIRQIERFQPLTIAVKTREGAERLRRLFPEKRVSYGKEGLIEVISHPKPDCIIAAINGTDALEAILQAVKMKVRIGLANKESMVVAGELINQISAKHGSEVLPIDSEQSAIFQCLGDQPLKEVKRIILTASGGPFFRCNKREFAAITPEAALAHPVWAMGKKITIDSATLMNKALEIIEAHYLFHVEREKIAVLIHPQSIIHSMVEFIDSVIMAQLSIPDMRIPILYSLSYPGRMESRIASVNLARLQTLEFFEVDLDKFPSICMAHKVLREGKNAGAVFNTANEVAVDLFLKNHISFSKIFELVDRIMQMSRFYAVHSLSDIQDTIKETREKAMALAKGD